MTGQHCLLGEAFIELNLLTRRQIDQAVTEQIIQLRNALEDANRFLEHRVAGTNGRIAGGTAQAL